MIMACTVGICTASNSTNITIMATSVGTHTLIIPGMMIIHYRPFTTTTVLPVILSGNFRFRSRLSSWGAHQTLSLS